MKNAILLAKNQEYVSQKCEKFYFSTKHRISAQNRIRPRGYAFRRFYTTRPLSYNKIVAGPASSYDDDDFVALHQGNVFSIQKQLLCRIFFFFFLL